MNSRTQRRKADAGSALFAAARNNPEGVLLLAAGAALLLRGGLLSGSSRPQRRGGGGHDPHDERSASSRWVDTDRVTGAMEDARDYVADLGSQAADTAASYAASASRYADDMRQTVAARSEELYEETTSTLGDLSERILRDQPFVVALAGLAAGAAFAAVFPRTEFEAQTLGPQAERMTEFAAETAKEFKDAGVAASERLKSAAEQRGLTPDGLKDNVRDLAREAADAFTGSLAGNKNAGQPTGETPSNPDRPT